MQHTPDYKARRREVAAFLDEGRLVDAWRGHDLLVTLDHGYAEPRWLAAADAQLVYENPSFQVYRWRAPSSLPMEHADERPLP